MSASREKKIRQEKVASGFVDPKEKKFAEERAAQKRSNTLYAVIGIAFVLVAALVIIWNSGMIQRNATAITIDGENYSTAEFGYFYTDAYNTWYQTYGSYASYFGLDTSKSLGSQLYDEETGETWADFFADQAAENMKWTIASCAAAEEAGYEWSTTDQASFDATKEALNGYAKKNNMSVSTYLTYVYGSYINESIFDKCLKMSTLANGYSSSIYDGFSYSESDIEAAYAENVEAYEMVDYDYLKIDGSAEAETDDEGNTIEATEEEKTAAMAAAKEQADALYASYQADSSLESLADDENGITYTHMTEITRGDTVLLNWAFDDERKAGDSSVLEDEDAACYYIAVFSQRYRYEYKTVDMRQMLFPVDKSGLTEDSETYDADLQALKDEALAKAKEVLAEWESGAKTPESFGELSDKYASANNTAGGLYTKVYKNSMVSAVNDWLFADGRKAGDVEIVESDEYGYHILLFVGENLPYWQVQVENALRTEDYNAWSDALTADMTHEFGTGVKYVKK